MRIRFKKEWMQSGSWTLLPTIIVFKNDLTELYKGEYTRTPWGIHRVILLQWLKGSIGLELITNITSLEKTI